MHSKHIWKWVLSSVAVLSVATVLVYNNSDYDSNVSKSEPKSDNLVPNVSAELHAKPESKDLHNDVVEVSQTSRYEDLVSNSDNLIFYAAVEKPLEQPKVVKPVEQPKVEKQVEQPKVEKPVEQPKVEKPVEQPRVEKPVEQPKVDKPVEQPKVEKPVEQPKVEKPVEQLRVEKPVEQPKVEKPVEQPVVSQKGTPEVRQELPEAVVTEKGIPEVQAELPQYVETQVGEPEIQPALPEAVVTEVGEPEVQPELPEFQSENDDALVQEERPEFHDAKGEPEVRQELPEAVVTEKGTPEVQPELPQYVETQKGEPLVQPALPEVVVTEKGTPEVQPALPQYVETQKGEPLVQEALPEAVVTEKGTPEVQPELPTYVETQKGEPLVQPTLPEAVVTEKGTPEVQPELPQYVETQKGEPLVQPSLPEAVVTEKGVPEVQPALTEAVVSDKGTPEVRPILNEYTLTIKTRKDVETIPTKFLNLGSIHMHEGERKKVIEGEPGSITKIYEDITGPDGTILKSTLKNEKIIDPIYHVYRYGVAPVNGKVGEDGLYRFSEHIDKLDVVAFNKGIDLNGDQIKALGQPEIDKRSKQDVENNLWLANPTNWTIVTVANAPLSDESIKKLDNGTYINHKNVGLEMLKLVNAERKRLGKSQLKWSDKLYELSRVRAEDIRDNGHIRFFAENGDVLKHVRNDKGKSWITVFDKTEFERRGVGENLAGFTLPRNIYKAFSEKAIAEQLYNQWKNSPGHYANMIADAYTEFGFDMSYSKFWRNDRTSVDYLAQGIHGVQLFAI